MRKYLLLTVGLLMSFGCSNTYNSSRTTANRLPRTPKLFVAVPEDGRFENTTYAGSGQQVAAAVAKTFAKYAGGVEVGVAPETHPQACVDAQSRQCAYLLFPTIVHWEDRATEWSGKSDRIEIRLVVTEIPGGRTVDSVMLAGKSKWMTFGGDVPEDMLVPSLEQYSKELFE